jgi:hypothetical protein
LDIKDYSIIGAFYVVVYSLKEGLILEDKYYFVSYEWNGYKSNAVLDEHPFVWIKEGMEKHKQKYIILFYKEITKEEYKLIHGWVD